MPKVTKKLGNNKARAWESLGFAHKKKLCQHFDTTSFPCDPGAIQTHDLQNRNLTLYSLSYGAIS